MRPLAALVGLLVLAGTAAAAPGTAGWPEPVEFSLRLLAGPDAGGSFEAELTVRARQAVEAVELALAPTPGITLDDPAPAFAGAWQAGEGLCARVRGRAAPADGAALPPGLSLALEYRYDPRVLVAALARGAVDRSGIEVLRAARKRLGNEPREARRMRFLAVAARPGTRP